MKPLAWSVLCSLALLAGASRAQELAPADFLWRATLEVPAGGSLVRVAVPAEALMRLQTPAAHDLRVFDGQMQRVPFAFNTPPSPSEAERHPAGEFRALPLHRAQAGGRGPRGSTQVRVDTSGEQQPSVWVQLTPGGTDPEAPRAARLPAALFDTRGLQQPVAALELRATLPRNVPVAVTAAVSTDLAQWTPVPLRGRLFRFEGSDAPANDTLELREPLALQGRYLRLDWSGQEGVEVQSLTVLANGLAPAPARAGAPLPAPRVDGATAVEWHLGFATPVTELALGSSRPQTLVPVRVLGRNEPTEPWRQLARAVVYRLGTGEQESVNPPIPLPGQSQRWLRVEATHGQPLDGQALTARAWFAPLEVVFVASGAAPYQLAVGRAYTPPAALPLSMLAATTSTGIDALPFAQIVQTNIKAPLPPPIWQQWVPSGLDSRAAGLWLVLGLGVLVLGAVAWSLMRQVKR